MAPVPFSAKALARLSAGRNGELGPRVLSIWSERRCREVGGGPDRFVQGRWFNDGARICNPGVGMLVDGGKGRTPSVWNTSCGVQSRRFLGLGNCEDDVLSKSHEQRLVMGYSPEQLFNVVAAVDLYKEFLPWCQRSSIVKRNKDGSFDAELEIGFKFFVESYVSHVELQKPRYVKTTALDTGLFDYLINIWEFNPGPTPGTCDLHFLVDFKFNSPLYRHVASMFFKEVVSRLVSSFSDRCHRIYGPGVSVLENRYGAASSSAQSNR
ncbi:hypothetical protein AXF42_Ash010480 [Apostasia shenzhenica]|uniref:Coenzyme Q-binding protein COQ10 START domain-containing protein n=1 Tax=Apostasia shenzhenica TaxID=1088818 RepID=A0A2I0BE45_9ASPA|nr:hypothetical protein AXF42_Ash010480 [Apostasia shenzhenica]